MEIANDPVNALTVDVEDYYQVESFADIVSRQDWARWESRIERNTHKLLEVFARHNARGTFFILGWIAERHPRLAREILSAGHEIACHSYDHQFILNQRREDFRADVRRAKTLIEDITGVAVEGYWAPPPFVMGQNPLGIQVIGWEGVLFGFSFFSILY